jgi:hypothetical protein
MSNIVMTIDKIDDTMINNEINIDVSEEELDNIFNNYLQEYYDPDKFWNDIKSQNKPTGIDIKTSNNEYTINPFESELDKQKSVFINNENKPVDAVQFMKTLDLDILKYSFEDILHLFNFSEGEILTEEKMKQAKRIVLKAHPDKSRLEEKYFLFFMNAYKHLNLMYMHQKKAKMQEDLYKKEEPFFVKDDPFFAEYQNECKQYNSERNETYSFGDWLRKTEKMKLWLEWRDLHFLELSNKNGYGEWLQSNDGLYEEPKPRPDKIDEKWKSAFEKMRENVNELAVYNNINKVTMSDTRGSALIDTTNNFTKPPILYDSSTLTYTDIKEAFTECIIPINPNEINISVKNKQSTNYKEILSSLTYDDENDNIKKLYHPDLPIGEFGEGDNPLMSAAYEFHYASKNLKNVSKNMK